MLTAQRPAADGHSDAVVPAGFAHVRALDGMRGLAVAAVLAFHSDAAWAAGGYLGVSAFFTLSGFLITTLLLRASQESGRVDLADFWARRVRRLTPVAVAGVLCATAFVVFLADASTIDRFASDALAALAGVANWHYVFSELSYADIFSGDSPLQHYWSLSIEQQFYVVFPVVAAWSLRPSPRGRSRDGSRRLAVVVVVGIMVSVGVSALVGGDRAYYGSDTRMAELLVGSLLAIAHHRRPVLARWPGALRTSLGGFALVGMAALWATVDQSSAWLHPWILLVHAALTAAVIAAVLGGGLVERTLASRPLAWFGRLSYGVYVFHWPVFLWLTPDRTDVDGVALAVLRIAVTLAIAVPVQRLVENPLRRRVDVTGRRLARVTVATGLAAAVVAVVPVLVIERAPIVDFDASSELQDSLADRTAAAVLSETLEYDQPSHRGTAVPPAPTVAIFGDSTALQLLPGFDAWALESSDAELRAGYAVKGCGIIRNVAQGAGDDVAPVSQLPCAFDVYWPAPLEAADPDIAVLSIGLWDLIDLRVPGDDETRAIGHPIFDDHLRAEIRAATDLLLEAADRVVWLLQPPPVAGTRDLDDPAGERVPRLNEIIVEAVEDDNRVGFVDLPAWLASESDGDNPLRLRPDGTHFDDETSVEAARWLGPAVLSASRRAGLVGPDDVVVAP